MNIDDMKYLYLFLILLVWMGCTPKTTAPVAEPQPIEMQKKPETLFTLLSAEQSGIDFTNEVIDSQHANVLIYESFYDGGGVAIGDINNDGLQDLYFAGNQVADKLYLNLGNLKFEDISDKSGINVKGGWSTGVNMIDINNDGWLDIYVAKSLYDDFPLLRINELYINQGDTTFVEMSQKYNLNDFWRTMHANFLDYDRDGDLDVFMVNQPPNPGMFSPLSGRDWLDTLFGCRLLEFQDSTFVEVTSQANVSSRGYALSAVSGDFNRDGWVDIYVANDYDGPDFLYMNNGDGTFTDKILEYMDQISYFSMGADAADINNDGWLDIIIVDMVAEDNYRIKANMGGMEPEAFWNIVNSNGHRQYMYNTLQLNQGKNKQGDIHFSEIGHLAGISNTDWSWSPLAADFDNDGHKDIFISNGLKEDLRNTDAVRMTEEYMASQLDTFIKYNPDRKEVDIWEFVDLQEILDILPQEIIANYIYRNEGNLTFKKAMQEWGLDQKVLSTGAAYGDLDNDGDLDLVVNNVDERSYVYENQANYFDHMNYLRVQLDKSPGADLFGTKVEITLNDGIQYYEFTSSRGFFSSSEQVAHFGLHSADTVQSVKVIKPSGKMAVFENVRANQTLIVKEDDFTDIHREPRVRPLFTDITDGLKIDFIHAENTFDDYEREVLIPHQMSILGPGMAVGDVNGDGLDDIYIGGAITHSGALYTQNFNSTFSKEDGITWAQDVYLEDMDAEFLDVDLDGDLDLYVVSGGNEYDANSYTLKDRLYLNDGTGRFTKDMESLPDIRISGSRVIPGDFDQDGDLDLFVGGRQTPGAYPTPTSSVVLKNLTKENGKLGFENITSEVFPGLNNIGMVTDAEWTDSDLDGDLDLIVVGEWMPVTWFENTNDEWVKHDLNFGNTPSNGWWFSIASADLDKDGDPDYVLGNLGLNYKYKASPQEPFSVFFDDFDENGSSDIVLSYYNFGERFPVRGRSCSSQQIPKLKEKFPNYDIFASSNINEIYGTDALQSALELNAYGFASVWLENDGKGGFTAHTLPMEAQVSNINDILIHDINDDTWPDLIVAGNLYGSEVETPRNDALIGLVLMGNGSNFTPVSRRQSGMDLHYDIKELQPIYINGIWGFASAANQDKLRIYMLNR